MVSDDHLRQTLENMLKKLEEIGKPFRFRWCINYNKKQFFRLATARKR